MDPERSNTINLTVRPKTYAIRISTNIVADQISLKVDGGIINASSLPKTYRWDEFTKHNITVNEYYEG